MKKCSLLFFLLLSNFLVIAQIRLQGFHQSDIAPQLYGNWKARWISLPNEPVNVYGVYHFRKTFELKEVPEKFIIHVSADNRYKLFINGNFVSLGPARCDTYNWNFETVDLAAYLKKGTNLLAAFVWNFADQKPAAQMSFDQTGFILQGNTDKEASVNTNKSWRCIKDEGHSPWDGPRITDFYVAGPGDMVKGALYPWGWEQPGFDDSKWSAAFEGLEGAMKDTRNYRGRMLVPSPIPPREMTPQRFAAVRIAEGITTPAAFPENAVPFTIPPNSKVRLILDNQKLTTGYLSLLYSKGKDAEIRIGYTEAFYAVDEKRTKGSRLPKGNRDELAGKRFFGYEDIIIPDGGTGRDFTTLWWRTWRYVELQVQTAAEPLEINDIFGTFSAYPFEQAYTFDAPGKPELNKMLDIGWLTARLCANETYMDCPYYEQLQYWGDTRIQAMVTMYNTNDRYMVKNAIEQGRQSIVADGITKSRYPSERRQFISSFSLAWVSMGYDYWRYRGDEAYLKTLLPAYRGVLAWFEQWLKKDNSLAYVPHWFFADWVPTFPRGGEPVRETEGNSSYQDLLYLLTLDETAAMEKAFGLPAMAAHYKDIATKIRSRFREKYWDASRKLFADTHDHRSYSQHVNAIAILAGIVKGTEATELMKHILIDHDIAKATIYFQYYINQALAKAGMGNELLDNIQPWKDQMALGLTTWAEQPEPSRSDCHAWSASPNIEFFRILLGIDSDGPGFKKIRIAPALGDLKEVSGTMPHPLGSIAVNYKIDNKGKLTASVNIPNGTSGTFTWKGKTYYLKEGKQEIIITN